MLNRKGFTLIELIIVIVIIGILASIAAPIMGTVKGKAICSEAALGLAAIRSALRQYYVEYSDYPPIAIQITVTQIHDTGKDYYLPGLTLRSATDTYGTSLDGVYFSQENYYISNLGQCNIIADYPPVNQGAEPPRTPKQSEVGLIRDNQALAGNLTMDVKTGKITQSNLSRSGF